MASEERMYLSLQEARNFDFSPASASKCLLERRLAVMAGDFWLGLLWNVLCLFYLFKEQINVQIPQYNYSEFCSCFYWISECCSSELFLRMLPLARFEALLAFLVCELIFVVGILEKSSREY